MTAVTDATTVLETLAGRTLDNPTLLRVVEGFINDTSGTAEEKAQQFLDTMIRIVKSTVRSHAETAQRQANDSGVTDAGNIAESDLIP